MSEFMNMIKGLSSDLDNQAGVPRHSTVSSVDTERGVVKVVLDEFGTESGWLPVVMLGAGNGWTIGQFPDQGAQVFCVPDHNDSNNLVVLGGVHFDQRMPGKIIPYGDGVPGSASRQPVKIIPVEFTAQHPSGAMLRLTDGAVEIVGDLRVAGNVLVQGEIRDLNGVHGTLDDLRQAYNLHEHTGVLRGGAKTDPADHPIP